MSWLYSRALVEDYSQATSSESERYALLSEMNSVDGFLCVDKTSGISQLSLYGMTWLLLTESRGVGLWTCYLADSPAKRSLLRLVEETTQVKTYGATCSELLEKCSLHLFLQKMFLNVRLGWPHPIFKPLAISAPTLPLARKTWVQTTFGSGIGYLHTPTTIANFAAPSMQKHPSCQNFVRVFGRPTPQNFEWMMGWPAGWTGLERLETGKFQRWLSRHF